MLFIYLRVLFTYLFPPSLAQATLDRDELRGCCVMPGCGEEPLFGQLKAQTISTKTPVLASPTRAETASGVLPTNLRISAR